NQVIRHLSSPTADTKRAGLMLYALQIAAQLTARKEHTRPEEFVHDLRNASGDEIDFSEAIDTGAQILAPDNTICEPATDCRNCDKQNTCPNYEEPEDKEEEEEETEESEEESDEDETTEQEPGDTEDDIDRKFLRALKLRHLERSGHQPSVR